MTFYSGGTCNFIHQSGFASIITQASGSLLSSPIVNNNWNNNIVYTPAGIQPFLDGCFIKIYKTDATTIGTDVINSAGIVLVSVKRLNVGIKNQIPFIIYNSVISLKYYDGFLYSPNDIPYSSYSTYFPSGTVFA